MLSSATGREPKGEGRRVQAGCDVESGTSGLRHRLMLLILLLLILLLLAGCSSFPSSMNPVSWWHDLQGGKIAEERPPPPGADQPYPNLASVPPKPAQPDRAALTNIANALISDRTNAQHVAAAAPIADPSSPSTSPALFGRGTVPPPAPAPPPGSDQASATLPAAEASTPPPTPTSRPPVRRPPASRPQRPMLRRPRRRPLSAPCKARRSPRRVRLPRRLPLRPQHRLRCRPRHRRRQSCRAWLLLRPPRLRPLCPRRARPRRRPPHRPHQQRQRHQWRPRRPRRPLSLPLPRPLLRRRHPTRLMPSM
jgi:hypothetical protein